MTQFSNAVESAHSGTPGGGNDRHNAHGWPGARFDWYAATVDDEWTHLLAVLTAGLHAEAVPGTPLHGYRFGYDIVSAAGTVARVLCGGNNDAKPHVWASGEDTMPLALLLRSVYPFKHKVTRVDSCIDYDGEGAWTKLLAACMRIANPPVGRQLKLDTMGDWVRAEDGRTLYVGSRKSPVLVRLYEKGKQMQAQIDANGEAFSPHWVRLEMQLRPQSPEAKERAGAVSPLEVWGFSKWTSELLADVDDIDVPRVNMYTWREADDARALRWMARQYGGALERLAKEVGGWARMGEVLGALVQREAGM